MTARVRRADGVFEALGQHVAGRQVHVDEDGHAAVLDDRGDRGGEAGRHGDDLVARLQAAGRVAGWSEWRRRRGWRWSRS